MRQRLRGGQQVVISTYVSLGTIAETVNILDNHTSH